MARSTARQAWVVRSVGSFLVLVSAGTACDGAILDGGETLQGRWSSEPKTAEGWPLGSCAAQSCSLGSELVAYGDMGEAELALVGRFQACSGVMNPVADYAGEEFAADGTHYYLLGNDLHRDPDPGHQTQWSVIDLSEKQGFAGQVQFKIALDGVDSVDWNVLSNCPRVLSNNVTTFVAVPEAP